MLLGSQMGKCTITFDILSMATLESSWKLYQENVTLRSSLMSHDGCEKGL